MEKVRKTSFGYIEILSEKPLVERMIFNKEGRAHTHQDIEYCEILSGSGRIIGANTENVIKGDKVSIPSGTEHYMIPKEKPFMVLISYGREE